MRRTSATEPATEAATDPAIAGLTEPAAQSDRRFLPIDDGRRLPPPVREHRPLHLVRDERLLRLVRERLAAWPVRAITDPRHTRAAVALAITDEGPGAGLPGLPRHGGWSEPPALILTRRAGGMRQHAGQWALPGGRLDAGETPEQAALRELAEEVGLQLEAPAVLGRLDDFATRSGYIITPVVVWAGDARQLRAEPGEVRSIHRIPVAEFMRPDAPLLDEVAHSLHPLLESGILLTAITAVVLNLFFNGSKADDRATIEAAKAAEAH